MRCELRYASVLGVLTEKTLSGDNGLECSTRLGWFSSSTQPADRGSLLKNHYGEERRGTKMARQITVEDQRIGNRLRVLRIRAGKSQSEIGQVIGISFQQIQKYENGTNRISSTNLARLAAAVGGDLTDFFPETKRREGADTDALMKLLADKQNFRALMAFAKIRPKLKAACLALLEEAAAGR